MALQYAGRRLADEFVNRNGRPQRFPQITVKNPDGSAATLYTSRTKATVLAQPLPIGVTPGTAGVDVNGNLLYWAVPGAYIEVVNGVEVTVQIMPDPDEMPGSLNSPVLLQTDSPGTVYAIRPGRNRTAIVPQISGASPSPIGQSLNDLIAELSVDLYEAGLPARGRIILASGHVHLDAKTVMASGITLAAEAPLQTVLKLTASRPANTQPVSMVTVDDAWVEGLILDSNRSAQTATSTHPVKIDDTLRSGLRRVLLRQSKGYGAAIGQDGANSELLLEDVIIEDVERDGLDSKCRHPGLLGAPARANLALARFTHNTGTIRRIIVRRFSGADIGEAGIDLRGLWTVDGWLVYDPAASDDKAEGLRLRSGELADSNGLGGHHSQITNGEAYGCVNGIGVYARGGKIIGLDVHDNELGVYLAGPSRDTLLDGVSSYENVVGIKDYGHDNRYGTVDVRGNDEDGIQFAAGCERSRGGPGVVSVNNGGVGVRFMTGAVDVLMNGPDLGLSTSETADDPTDYGPNTDGPYINDGTTCRIVPGHECVAVDIGGPSRVVNDGVTTNGDATLTSATAAFTDADVDAPISGAGIPANTYIASVTTATTVELSANATATASGVTVTIAVGYRIPHLATKCWELKLVGDVTLRMPYADQMTRRQPNDWRTIIRQDTTGGRTLTWDPNVPFADAGTVPSVGTGAERASIYDISTAWRADDSVRFIRRDGGNNISLPAGTAPTQRPEPALLTPSVEGAGSLSVDAATNGTLSLVNLDGSSRTPVAGNKLVLYVLQEADNQTAVPVDEAGGGVSTWWTLLESRVHTASPGARVDVYYRDITAADAAAGTRTWRIETLDGTALDFGAQLWELHNVEPGDNMNTQSEPRQSVAQSRRTTKFGPTLPNRRSQGIGLVAVGGTASLKDGADQYGSSDPFILFTTNGSPTVLTVPNASSQDIGKVMTADAGGILPDNAVITNVVGNTVTLDANATATAVGTAGDIWDGQVPDDGYTITTPTSNRALGAHKVYSASEEQQTRLYWHHAVNWVGLLTTWAAAEA